MLIAAESEPQIERISLMSSVSGRCSIWRICGSDAAESEPQIDSGCTDFTDDFS